MGLAPAQVIAALRRRKNVRQVFDRTRTHQRLPMRAPGGLGKCRRHDNDVHILHGAVQLRKAQVVANRQSDAPERRIRHLDVLARLERPLFREPLRSEVQVEQVNLVIPRDELAVVIVQLAGIVDLAFAGGGHRHGATHQPDLVFLRRIRQKTLDRAVAVFLADLDLVAGPHAHDREVLRQRDQSCALMGRYLDEPASLVQIGGNVWTGSHLHPGNAKHLRFRLTFYLGGYRCSVFVFACAAQFCAAKS